MTSRHHSDWLAAFMDYAKYGEAPKHMYFWAGASAIAGALRRRVWIDQAYFRWHCNMYVILVAPPGIVSKSTTSGMAMNLLRQVPGVNFGPDVVSWQALVEAFGESTEGFDHQGEIHAMSPLTLESSEFGNLVNPQDKDMIDLLVSLWDGKQGSFEKRTKHSGNDSVENPWINLIACTTPSWIAGNFPEYMIGGGFTSRCIFVYADKKAQFVAYPGLVTPKDLKLQEQRLVEDLTSISKLTGEFKLTPSAIAWGEAWYHAHYTTPNPHLEIDRFGGYIARKQVHIHKLAMILSASEGSSLLITPEHLATASTMITDLEPEMSMVFNQIGKSEASAYVDKLIWFVEAKGKVEYQEAYRYVHSYFPSIRDFEDLMLGAVKAGFIRVTHEGSRTYLLSAKKAAQSAAS